MRCYSLEVLSVLGSIIRLVLYGTYDIKYVTREQLKLLFCAAPIIVLNPQILFIAISKAEEPKFKASTLQKLRPCHLVGTKTGTGQQRQQLSNNNERHDAQQVIEFP